MSTDVRPLVEQIARTRGELADALGDPELPSDRARYAAVSKRWADLSEAFELAALWEDAADRAGEAEALLAEDDDDEVRSLLEEARAELADLGPRIREAMIEPDPDDDRNTIVEIRAGTGGEEAALFARDLVEIYSRYAESRGLAVELMAASEADAGGLREATLGVKGRGAYAVFKHEAGVHRVQRIPATESQGRIHTSTATVAVLPEVEDVDVTIDPNDVKRDVYRSSGPGGQSVNTTDSAVRADPPAHRDRGVDAGREEPAPELRARHAGAARAALRAPAGRAGRGAHRDPALAARLRRPLREGAHLQLPPEPGDRPPRGPDACRCASRCSRGGWTR